MSTPGAQSKKDFFISYTHVDRDWAEWIAWQLEAAGYSVVFQGWDFLAGFNFVLKMDRATKEARRTLMVLSPDALNSPFVQAEWAAAFRQDPAGQEGTLLPVRVRECRPIGLLASVVYADLVGLDEGAALQTLLAAAGARRIIPSNPPAFPGLAHVPARTRPYFPPARPTQDKRRIPRRGVVAGLVGAGTLILSGSAWAVSTIIHKIQPTPTPTHTLSGTPNSSLITDTPALGTDTSSATVASSPAVTSGRVLFQASFSDPQKIYDEWSGNILSGGIGWRIAGGLLICDGGLTDETIWATPNSGGTLPTANYSVEAQIQVTALPNGNFSAPYVGIFVRGQPSSLGGYLVNIGGLFALDTAQVTITSLPNPIKKARYPLDLQTHNYYVQVEDNTITFSIDGHQLFQYTDPDKLFPSAGQVGLATSLVPAKVSSFTVTAL
jgi:TIR domain